MDVEIKGAVAAASVLALEGLKRCCAAAPTPPAPSPPPSFFPPSHHPGGAGWAPSY